MRSVYFSEILHTALQLAGLDRGLTTPERFSMVRDFASMRLRSVWEMNEWTDLKVITQCPVVFSGERRTVPLAASLGQVITIWDKDPLAYSATQRDFELIDGVINLHGRTRGVTDAAGNVVGGNAQIQETGLRFICDPEAR